MPEQLPAWWKALKREFGLKDEQVLTIVVAAKALLLNPLEAHMSAETEALGAAVSTLLATIGEEVSEIRAGVDELTRRAEANELDRQAVVEQTTRISNAVAAVEALSDAFTVEETPDEPDEEEPTDTADGGGVGTDTDPADLTDGVDVTE